MRVSLADLVAVMVAAVIFVVSVYFVPLYYLGDQEHYIKVYEAVPFLGYEEALVFYRSNINSVEFFHFWSIWALGGVICKSFYVSVLNSILAFAAFRAFSLWGARWYVAAIVVLTNYYFWVVYVPVERLKIALIFIFFAYLVRNVTGRFFLYACAALSHVSVFLLIVASLISNYLFDRGRLVVKWQLAASLIFLVGVSCFVFEQLYIKILGYSASLDSSILSYGRSLLLFLLSYFYAKNRTLVVFLFLLIFFAIAVVGEGRVNMFSYILFLYFAFQFRGGLNFGWFITSLYFFYSTVNFFLMTLEYGTTDILQISKM